MQNKPPFYLCLGIPLCWFFSDLVTGIHYCIVRTGVLKIPLYVQNAPGGIYKNLRNIWFSRVFRRVVSVLVRTPLRNKILKLVDVRFPLPDTGIVITMCHTPWSRLLAEWCIKNNFGIIITDSKWRQQAYRIKRTGKGFRELRYLIRYLRSGGKVIIMADVFNNLRNCSAKFIGKDYNVSLLPVRLARIAEVPIIAAVPEMREGNINIYSGPQSDVKTSGADLSSVMQGLMSFFEKEIKRNPSIWSVFVRESLSGYQR